MFYRREASANVKLRRKTRYYVDNAVRSASGALKEARGSGEVDILDHRYIANKKHSHKQIHTQTYTLTL